MKNERIDDIGFLPEMELIETLDIPAVGYNGETTVPLNIIGGDVNFIARIVKIGRRILRAN